MNVKSDAIYYALILIFLGFTLYFLSPALFPRSVQPTPSIITFPNEYPLVQLTILTSSNCNVLCSTQVVENALKTRLVNLNVTYLEVESEAGQRLAQALAIELVPAYILDQNVERNPGFAGLSTAVQKTGSNYVLKSVESGSGYLFKRQKTEQPTIVQFVGALDLNSLIFQNTTFNVLKLFNNSVSYSIHYAIRTANDSYLSVSGYSEVVESAIQLCAAQTRAPNFLNAIACRNREIISCYNSSSVAFCAQSWEVCIGGWGINETEVTQCIKTQNQTLLGREVSATLEESITVVPTTIVGNQYRVVGQLSESELRGVVCAAYPLLEGCVIRVNDND